MVFARHSYITDGVPFRRNFVMDENFQAWRVADVFTQWKRISTFRRNLVTDIQSFDGNTFAPSELQCVVDGGMVRPASYITEAGRNGILNLDGEILTENGYKPLRNVGIGERLLTMDSFRKYYGDGIPLTNIDGSGRLRAFLRNHSIKYALFEKTGTNINGTIYYIVDYDTDYPVELDHSVTLGLNNWREYVKAKFGVGEYAYDPIVKIEPIRKEHTAVIQTDSDNMILHTGVIIQTSKMEVRDDRRRNQSIDARAAKAFKQRLTVQD